jgi:hypothetical protein
MVDCEKSGLDVLSLMNHSEVMFSWAKSEKFSCHFADTDCIYASQLKVSFSLDLKWSLGAKMEDTG